MQRFNGFLDLDVSRSEPPRCWFRLGIVVEVRLLLRRGEAFHSRVDLFCLRIVVVVRCDEAGYGCRRFMVVWRAHAEPGAAHLTEAARLVSYGMSSCQAAPARELCL